MHIVDNITLNDLIVFCVNLFHYLEHKLIFLPMYLNTMINLLKIYVINYHQDIYYLLSSKLYLTKQY